MDIQYGDEGSAVAQVQSILTANGYASELTAHGESSGGVDGIFGADTLAAVKSYQSDNGLPVTGVVDLATRTSLGIADPTSDTLQKGAYHPSSGALTHGEATPSGSGVPSGFPWVWAAAAVVVAGLAVNHFRKG